MVKPHCLPVCNTWVLLPPVLCPCPFSCVNQWCQLVVCDFGHKFYHATVVVLVSTLVLDTPHFVSVGCVLVYCGRFSGVHRELCIGSLKNLPLCCGLVLAGVTQVRVYGKWTQIQGIMVQCCCPILTAEE